MTFTAGRCPSCGGDVQLDDSKEHGYCLHCGNRINVQDAVTKLKVEFPDSLKVDGITEKEKLKDAAKILFDAGKLEEAEDLWDRVVRIDPTDGDGHLGLCYVLLKTLQKELKKANKKPLLERKWILDYEELFADDTNYIMAKKYADNFLEFEQQYKLFTKKIDFETRQINDAKKRRKKNIIRLFTWVPIATFLLIFILLISFTDSGIAMSFEFAISITLLIFLFVLLWIPLKFKLY